MKKYLALITAAAAIISVTGCSSSSKIDVSSSTGAPSAAGGPTTGAPSSPAATEYKPTDIGGVGTAADKDKSDGGLFDMISESFSDVFGSGGIKNSVDSMEEATIAADDGAYGDLAGVPAAEGEYGEICPVDPDFPVTEYIPPQAGLLTGGEWRDNDHWADWLALYNSHGDWNTYKKDWRIKNDVRIEITVTDPDGNPVDGAKINSEAVTDNKGKAYIFRTGQDKSDSITVTYGEAKHTEELTIDTNSMSISVQLDVKSTAEKKLDFMIMCDTTGSMSDELSYLQVELEDIIGCIQRDNANIPTRLSINFYRDEGDEYVVREYPFTADIEAASREIGQQNASGGGDFPEAVHTALDSAINNHDWDEDSTKIMFLVLDAPPHSEAQIVDSVHSSIEKAAAMGIRIIPIASSGIDKSTEYLLRYMAFTTGGTYTFLTNDSGVGGGHIEPTVGAYNVEKLNDMMVRIVNGYLE